MKYPAISYIFDKKSSTISRIECSPGVVNEEAAFVDYAELRAFSSLPLCVRELLNR
jgi:hypothetical protein